MEAHLVPHERLPADRVAINSRVTYEEQPGGTIDAGAPLGRKLCIRILSAGAVPIQVSETQASS